MVVVLMKLTIKVMLHELGGQLTFSVYHWVKATSSVVS
jgi:hypothetical protein